MITIPQLNVTRINPILDKRKTKYEIFTKACKEIVLK